MDTPTAPQAPQAITPRKPYQPPRLTVIRTADTANQLGSGKDGGLIFTKS